MSCEAAKTTDGELKTNLCSGTLHYKNGATFPGSALHQSLAP
jgi:hypothetical protein